MQRRRVRKPNSLPCDWTPEQFAAFEARVEEAKKEMEPFFRACRQCEQITRADLDIVINARAKGQGG